MEINKPVIVDTSAFYALYSLDDALHKQARKIATQLFHNKRQVILLGDVFSELLNIIGKKRGKQEQHALGKSILSSNAFYFVEATLPLRQKAVDKLSTIKASVSYTDCLVMTLADIYETKEIFGFDNIFKQKGYTPPHS